MDNPAEPMTFVVELERVEDESVYFRYVIDGHSGLHIAKDWWESMGRPDTLEATLTRNPYVA